MKKPVLYIFLLLASLGLWAQNDAHFTQYMFNEVTFNPASIEVSNTINASMIARQQWVGFENAPSTQAINASSYVQNLFGGVGVNLMYDRLGIEGFIAARAFYAFPVQVGVLSQLKLGLGAGIVNRNIDATKLNYGIDEGHPDYADLLTHRESFLRPDFNFGVEFNDPNITAGFAVMHLYRGIKNAQIDYAPRHYYLYGKYLIEDVFDNVDIEPYLLFKSSWFMTQFDINVLAYYDNMIWGGFSYRLGDAVAAMVGYYITPDIRVGYSYDYAIGVSRGYSGGSHEIMIATSFEGFNKTRVTPKTPRIFN